MLFGFGKKKETGITLQQKLEERTEVLGKVLKKKGMKPRTARVCIVMDTSGSMHEDFSNGLVQEVTERIMPLALKFDDNKELEFYTFSNSYKELTPVTLQNIEGYIKKIVMPSINWGGTYYAPVINEITNRYGKKDPSSDPTFVVFITDGDNSDRSATTRAIKEAAKYNIFFKFVGIGNARMIYLEELDDMEGRVVDNANFFQVKKINAMSDEDLYSKILEEYDEWIEKATKLGILN